ncbi:MAG TPA: MarR family transcriptional regulator [Geobacteraceae bacterium]
METMREQLQIFVRRFGLLNASCCELCCGEQVSIVQSHILFEVRRAGTPSMQQVAEELGMEVTTFSRQAKTLETKGLIIRSTSPDDRRVNLLSLTDRGLQVLTQIDHYMETKMDQVFSSMTPFERDTVIRALGLLNEAVARTGGCSENIVVNCK